jgi:hypothetical protein
MGKALIALALAALVAVSYGLVAERDAQAGAFGQLRGAVEAPPLYTQVLIFKDCQRVALCTGCQPVYRCRACEYKRICAGRRCHWGDVCVWGPYVKVLPRGARIIPQ